MPGGGPGGGGDGLDLLALLPSFPFVISSFFTQNKVGGRGRPPGSAIQLVLCLFYNADPDLNKYPNHSAAVCTSGPCITVSFQLCMIIIYRHRGMLSDLFINTLPETLMIVLV